MRTIWVVLVLLSIALVLGCISAPQQQPKTFANVSQAEATALVILDTELSNIFDENTTARLEQELLGLS